MRWRDLFPALPIALLLTVATFAGCDGSPTEPGSTLPDVSGAWTGTWGIGNFGLRATMNLTQDGSGGVTGDLGVVGVHHSIVGTVTPTRFSFRLANVPAGECPNLVGDLDFTFSGEAVTRMSGTASQDNLACDPDGQDMTGRMSLSRTGS